MKKHRRCPSIDEAKKAATEPHLVSISACSRVDAPYDADEMPLLNASNEAVARP